MVSFRLATAADIPALLPLMRDFYAFERLPFDEERSRRLLAQLVADERLGRVLLFESAGTLAGYLVLGFGFSLEFHGLDALLDEFYVAPAHRSQGIGAQAIDEALRICREAGIAALHLEADHFNERAHAFYRRRGFKDHERHLMTRWL